MNVWNWILLGQRIFSTTHRCAALGQLQISETHGGQLDRYGILITGVCIWLTTGSEGREHFQTTGGGRMDRGKGEQVCCGKHGRKIPISDSVCCSTFCNQCGIEPDQPYRTSKSDSRSFHRGSVGGCGFYHDHRAEDQDQRFWRISERDLHTRFRL